MDDGGFVPGSMPAFDRASRGGRFDGDGEGEEEDDDDVGKGYFSKRAVPAGLEMEIALMREEQERDQRLKEEKAGIVDRREWENREVGVGYQHKTVVRQAQAVHDKVQIKDLSTEKKPKKSAEEKEAPKVLKCAKEAELTGGALLPPTAEALERLQALLRLELRKRKRQRGDSLLVVAHTAAAPGSAEAEGEEGPVGGGGGESSSSSSGSSSSESGPDLEGGEGGGGSGGGGK